MSLTFEDHLLRGQLYDHDHNVGPCRNSHDGYHGIWTYYLMMMFPETFPILEKIFS